MLRKHILIILISVTICSCNNAKERKMSAGSKNTSLCSEECQAKSNSEISCKLTTPELQKRKETVLASLKRQLIEKKELKDGYAFKFNGSDEMVDELTEFIKTERVCCDFFTFNLSISGDKSTAWLEMKGVEGAKEFISNELGL